MTTPPQNQTGSDSCMMLIAFPITSDEQAVETRRKIKEVIVNIEGLRFDFRITSAPVRKNGVDV